MEDRIEPIDNRKAAEAYLVFIEDFATRALATEVLTTGERKTVEQSRRALRASFGAIVDLIIDLSLKEKPKSTDILYQAMLALMSNSFLLGSITRVSNAARTVTKKEQAETARTARSQNSARDARLAAVRAAMEATVTKPTRGEAYARLIEPDANKRLGLEGDDKLSIWTIRSDVRAILEEAPRKSGKS